MYLYQLTSDLDQHAQYLHSRDVHNMVEFMHAHREFQFLKSRITIINFSLVSRDYSGDPT